MQVCMVITADEYDALVRHAAEASPASRALSTAAILSHLDGDGISQAYEVSSDEVETRSLLALAQSHSPSAMRKIIVAIRQSYLAQTEIRRQP